MVKLMIQDLIVYFAGLLVVGGLGFKLYRFIFIRKGQNGKCAGCTGCSRGAQGLAREQNYKFSHNLP